jgi:hypothetical protein
VAGYRQADCRTLPAGRADPKIPGPQPPIRPESGVPQSDFKEPSAGFHAGRLRLGVRPQAAWGAACSGSETPGEHAPAGVGPGGVVASVGICSQCPSLQSARPIGSVMGRLDSARHTGLSLLAN